MPEPAATTPLLEQYESVKARFPGHLVLFRVGDFYETFGDDARRLSKELEIVLTARAPDREGERTPMAGVPHHALESYLGRLLRKGFRVAVCDQVEDARLAKGLVRREVTRVVTPGTVVEDRILPGPGHNFLASVVVPADSPAGFALVDITTGEWFDGTAPTPGADPLVAELAPFFPREILLAGPSERTGPVRSRLAHEFPSARIELLEGPVPAAVAAPLPPPEGASAAVAEAAIRLGAYLATTQPRLVPFLERVPLAPRAGRLRLDGKTLRHLEIVRPMNPDDPSGPTLLSVVDETATALGRRTLAFWLTHPLADVAAIRARQEAVATLASSGAALLALRAELGPVADIARIAARVAGRRVRPPELAALRTSLAAVERARAWTERAGGTALAPLAGRLAPVAGLADRLARALPDEPPATVEAGGLFRPGFAPELDALARAEADGVAALEALERTEQSATQIRTLRVGFNQVFGYYFEVTRPHLAKVPDRFHRKQTLSGAERFTTDELTRIEAAILSARADRAQAEAAAWERLLTEIEPDIPRVHRLARAVGELDVLAGFALLAQERGYVRPEVDDGTVLQVRDGRHPVLDRTLDGRFVPNDVDLDAAGGRLLVLTGPNMSGKSTYMRAVGLLVVLAQVGAFVPARYARVGVASALFTRMGFTDEIGRGKSSFMVEMAEVGEILAAADARSIVLLDEVGRGTSTFDGLALAWATLRHLHDRIGCRTVLATHYHQLTDLVEGLKGARNAHLAVRDEADGVVFLHRLVPGSTDRSLGLHVARLAGLPPELLAEAARLLKRLEADGIEPRTGRDRRSGATRYTQAILLGPPAPPPSPVAEAIRALDVERMTPIEALAFLAEWRRRLGPAGTDAP